MSIVQTRSRRPVWDAEGLSHRHERQAHVVMEDEDGALVEREPAEGLLQLVSVGDLLDVVHVTRDVGVKHVNGRCPPSIPRCVCVTGVNQDPEGPCLEAVGIAEVRELAPDGQQGVLQHVLGERGVADDPPGDPQQRVADLVHQI